MAKQRIPKDITIEDLAIFAESIGCIVDIRFTDKQRPTKRAPDAAPRPPFLDRLRARRG